MPLVTDEKTATWVKRLDQAATDNDLLQVRKDFLATYPLEPAEVDSIFFRMNFHTVDIEAMKSGLVKSRRRQGLCIVLWTSPPTLRSCLLMASKARLAKAPEASTKSEVCNVIRSKRLPQASADWLMKLVPNARQT